MTHWLTIVVPLLAVLAGIAISACIILTGRQSEDTDHPRRRRALGRAAARARAQSPAPRCSFGEAGVVHELCDALVCTAEIRDGDRVVARMVNLEQMDEVRKNVQARLSEQELARRQAQQDLGGDAA